MTHARLIIDAHGLPHANGYYTVFPHEPSPEGELEVTEADTVASPELTVLTLLDELAKAGKNGTALVVCHAEPHGLRVRMDAHGTFLSDMAVEVIEESDRGLASATAIRAMPQADGKQIQDKKNAWQSLNERIGMGLVGTFDLTEASDQFDRWFASQASKISVGPPALRQLIAKSQTLRSVGLDRIEFRACDLGIDAKAMTIIKRFFGCKRMLAPRCRTFYLPPLTIESLPPLTPVQPPGKQTTPVVMQSPTGSWFAHRIPGPAGMLVPKGSDDDVDFQGKAIQGKKRKFFNGRAFMVIGIWQEEEFVFAGVGAAPRPAGRGAGATSRRRNRPAWMDDPDWTQVAEVARSLFMFDSTKYRGRNFPFAGLWNPPDGGFPWLVPNERQYQQLITKV